MLIHITEGVNFNLFINLEEKKDNKSNLIFLNLNK